MPNVDFKYIIELLSAEGAEFGRREIQPDWGPARDWARMEAVRLGRIAEGEIPGAVITRPLWSEVNGRPHVEGFGFVFAEGAGEGFEAVTGVNYLQNWAEVFAAVLVQSKKLEPGDSYRYRIYAYPAVKNGAVHRTENTPFEEPAIAFGLTDRPLSDLGELDLEIAEDEYPVFFPRQTIVEMEEQTEAAGGKETGGILVGKLFRDPEQEVIFAEVTAQIPARHVEATETNLAFTPETWVHARKALRLRRKGEIFLGWFHSHPVKEWCKECPSEKREKCPLLVDFFSTQDRHLHRTAFPGAHSIALVVNQLAEDHQTISLFGWKRGVLSQRSFQEIQAPSTQPVQK